MLPPHQLLRYAKLPVVKNLQVKLIAPALTINRRDLHISTVTRKVTPLKSNLQTPLAGIGQLSLLRYASNAPVTANIPPSTNVMTEATSAAADKTVVDLTSLPEAPIAPTEELVTTVLNAAGEPTFASIGLGGWSPVGLVQNCMEWLHISCDIPWWGAIAIGTVVVRTVLFPLVIMAQRNGAKMNNNMPQMQVLQMKMSEARQTGNAIDAARYAQEMMLFMKEKELNPLKNLFVPLAQAPIFISFFMGLRGMANTPVESLRDGGLFWFTDLTIADPTFMLPIITSATLYLTIEVGTDSARLSAANMGMMKYVLRALPIAIFPFTMNFPAAILTYWACSNFISLGQVALLKIPQVRDYFKIDKMMIHAAGSLPAKSKGFVGGVKESWQNMKISKELEERQQLNEIRFAKAGKGPLIKTYKYDPTKPQPTAVQAKPKDV
ncbi:mitochondrial inner membrane protein OXA1L-like [Teleopsis dalmanni]|uniref:mitochondrial inner membrane protein OXA1L-like n=1 Tax=Teleopsis dalmanni TaxID=139649 RepID=UPI0018CCB95D|nr:mitochondrial inner membrane protein OXA1L-like [Teleopsis dalmanni]